MWGPVFVHGLAFFLALCCAQNQPIADRLPPNLRAIYLSPQVQSFGAMPELRLAPAPQFPLPNSQVPAFTPGVVPKTPEQRATEAARKAGMATKVVGFGAPVVESAATKLGAPRLAAAATVAGDAAGAVANRLNPAMKLWAAGDGLVGLGDALGGETRRERETGWNRALVGGVEAVTVGHGGLAAIQGGIKKMGQPDPVHEELNARKAAVVGARWSR